MNERPVTDVPRAILAALAIALLLQVGARSLQDPPSAGASDLGPAPSAMTLKLAAFGDPIPVAKLLMLFLQSFDLQASNQIRYQAMNYDQLTQWLKRILELDPGGQYPLLAASQIYAEVPDPARQRRMLAFISEEFFTDPQRRWPWLAHAAYIAKHQLRDLPLARQFAADIQKYAHGPNVPLWARQMEAFILEDMNELEAARIMIGGYIASGQMTDPGELRVLEERLKQIEARLRAKAQQ
jgi:hypothetical protein